MYQRAVKENPGNPFAEWATVTYATQKSPAPLIDSPAEGVAEGLFGIAASLNDQRSTDVAILYLNLTLYLRPEFDLAACCSPAATRRWTNSMSRMGSMPASGELALLRDDPGAGGDQ